MARCCSVSSSDGPRGSGTGCPESCWCSKRSESTFQFSGVLVTAEVVWIDKLSEVGGPGVPHPTRLVFVEKDSL